MLLTVVALMLDIVTGNLSQYLQTAYTQSFAKYQIVAITNDDEYIKNRLDSAQRVFLCCGANASSDFETKQMVKPNACGYMDRGCITATLIIELAIRLLFTLTFIVWLCWFVMSLLRSPKRGPNPVSTEDKTNRTT